jgi:sugar phosphate isomerase/epimerase
VKLAFALPDAAEAEWDTAIRAAANLGFSGMELPAACDAERCVRRLAALTTPHPPPTICNLRTGITIPSGGSDFRTELESALKTAQQVGSKSVTVRGGSLDSTLPYFDAVAPAVGELREAAASAQAHGIRVLVETQNTFARAEAMDRLLRHTRHPNVAVAWDVETAFRLHGETVTQVWSHLGPYVAMVRLRDSRSGSDGVPKPCRPGEGEIPLREALALLEEEAFEGWLILDWITEPGLNPASLLAAGANLVRTLN